MKDFSHFMSFFAFCMVSRIDMALTRFFRRKSLKGHWKCAGMRTTEEIIRAVHTRTEALQKRREKTHLILTGGAGTVLAGLLVLMISSLGGLQHEVRPTQFAGASLLEDSAGGYVLAAVVAFMAGVLVMVIRQSRLKKTREEKDEHSAPVRDENAAN